MKDLKTNVTMPKGLSSQMSIVVYVCFSRVRSVRFDLLIITSSDVDDGRFLYSTLLRYLADSLR